MVYYDSNGDMNISASDNIDESHLECITNSCDFDNNGSVSICEIHDCVVMAENVWREDYCEYSEDLYCMCPFINATCDNLWTCEDIEAET
jgi:hypothetical protein